MKMQAAEPAKTPAGKAKSAEAKPAKTADLRNASAAKPAQGAPAKVAKLEAAPTSKVQQAIIKQNVDPQPTASLPPKAEAAPAADANPEFRWPARGRIIQGFKSGGNDGINISVPEGTAVKAAENGVVAYAGSELKGYGNLVLIRHPNGFVSAYANNGEIEVKRGDNVKRGQTIAKSGQSGNVATPQLHFELRKGSTPVDPTNYLAGL
jgi:murein DD-endopeptidase MepM/ murein hydrolase activator NlpD